jgi:hypothetical protein
MNDFLLSPIRLSELEILIEKSVQRALKQQADNIPLPTEAAPILSAVEVRKMTGWPAGTFYAKVAQMPAGVVIRGKSKRLLFDRAKFLQWLQNPA